MVQTLQGSNLEDRVAIMHRAIEKAGARALKEYQDRFDMIWIYHDSALEGVVYSMEELNLAFGDEPVTDTAIIPVYDEIRNHKIAIDMIRELSDKKRSTISADVIKKLFAQLAPEELEGKTPPKYRKDMPLHRLYFHEISPPEKISYRMRQLIDWANDSETRRSMHPIRLASKLHYELMQIYPFPRHSGKVARLVMNLVLERSDYPPVVIHSTERQRYYEALKQGENATAKLVHSALASSIESTIRYFDELDAQTA
ncbi:MAG: Fic family protein [Polyangiales bacterium]